jgi:uncharacterized protein YdcH (DUF465 family)
MVQCESLEQGRHIWPLTRVFVNWTPATSKLDHQIVEQMKQSLQLTPSRIAALKKQKLKLKEEIEALSDDDNNRALLLA